MLLTELANTEGRGFLSRLRDKTVEQDLKKLIPVYGSREAVFAEAKRRRDAARKGVKNAKPLLSIGVSYVTIVKACTHGAPIRDFAVAQKLADATGGRVSVPEICDPEGSKKRGRRRKAA